MNDIKLWITFWICCAVVFCVLTISLSVFYTGKDAKIVDMVKLGADPMMAACSVDQPNRENCRLYFVNKK